MYFKVYLFEILCVLYSVDILGGNKVKFKDLFFFGCLLGWCLFGWLFGWFSVGVMNVLDYLVILNFNFY